MLFCFALSFVFPDVLLSPFFSLVLCCSLLQKSIRSLIEGFTTVAGVGDACVTSRAIAAAVGSSVNDPVVMGIATGRNVNHRFPVS